MEDSDEPLRVFGPPELNKPLLWLSILLPPCTSLLAAALTIRLWHLNSEDLAVAGMWVVGAIWLGSWILFAKTLLSSYRGRTAIILIVFYPIAQVPLSTAIYVGSCLGGTELSGKSY